MKIFVSSLIALCLVPLSALAEPSELSGTVTHVRDGDTIEVDSVPVRLQGLHAPELDTPAGREAANFMQAHVLGKAVKCQLTGEKTGDRFVGICWLNKRDIAVELIRVGLGRDCPRYSGGRYADVEPEMVKSMPLPGYCV